MQHSDNESKIQQLQTTSARDERPPPLVKLGQSVHHFWVSWMVDATEPPKQMKQKQRPKWFSALITSQPEWEFGKYGGAEFEGWHYTTH